MPIKVHENGKGYYVQWGTHGAKYYFNPNSERSFEKAHERAILQMSAAFYNGYREKNSIRSKRNRS